MLLNARLAQIASRGGLKNPKPSGQTLAVSPAVIAARRGYAEKNSSNKEIERTESTKRRPARTLRRRPDLDFFDNTLPTFENVFRQPFAQIFSDFIHPMDDLDIWRPTSLLSQEATSWIPNADVTETNEQFQICLEVPGITKENLKIRIEDDRTLIVSGEKKTQTEDQTGTTHRKEISYGSFQRTWSLPENVNGKDIKANYENGVLKVTLPKTTPAVEKGVEVPIE